MLSHLLKVLCAIQCKHKRYNLFHALKTAYAFTQPAVSSYTPLTSAVLKPLSQLTYASGTIHSVPKHPDLLVVQSVTIAMNQAEIFHYCLLLA